MWRLVVLALSGACCVMALPHTVHAQESRCVELFSQTKFEGRSLRLCESTKGMHTKGWSAVRSVKVHGGVWVLESEGSSKKTLQPGDYATVALDDLRKVNLTTQRAKLRKAKRRRRGPKAGLHKGRPSHYRIISMQTSKHLAVHAEGDKAPKLASSAAHAWEIVPGSWAAKVMFKHTGTKRCMVRRTRYNAALLGSCAKGETTTWQVKPKPANNRFVQIMVPGGKQCLAATDKGLVLKKCDSKNTEQRFMFKEIAGTFKRASR